MGMSLFSETRSTPIPPDPDPRKFQILKITKVGDFVVATVHYDGCTTFMGNKVLVYETTEAELRKRKRLDPHFTHDVKSPIARFKGRDEGEVHATLFAMTLMHMRAIESAPKTVKRRK